MPGQALRVGTSARVREAPRCEGSVRPGTAGDTDLCVDDFGEEIPSAGKGLRQPAGGKSEKRRRLKETAALRVPQPASPGLGKAS